MYRFLPMCQPLRQQGKMIALAGIAALLLSLAFAAIFRLEAQAGEIDMCPAPVASADIGQETVEAPGLPNFGKWMLDHSGSPAHWLGEIYQGKRLREPINVVIVDTHANSVADAKERVVEASARAGYTIRMGHSSGYRALIAGEPHDQLPAGWDDAFSNHLFEMTNNHGRMFGPFQQGPSYILIGAFSREEVLLLHWPSIGTLPLGKLATSLRPAWIAKRSSSSPATSTCTTPSLMTRMSPRVITTERRLCCALRADSPEM
jgi:hypothetical protein